MEVTIIDSTFCFQSGLCDYSLDTNFDIMINDVTLRYVASLETGGKSKQGLGLGWVVLSFLQ